MAFSTHDIVPDSPTNNFCTLNPLASNLGTASLSIFEGNLKAKAINNGNKSILSTLAISSGKWYFETVITTNPSWFAGELGFREVSQKLIYRETDNSLSYGITINQAGAWNKLNSGSAISLLTSNYSSGATVIGMAFDADAGTLSISKDGVWENNIYGSIPSGTYQTFTTVYYQSGLVTTSTLNFGQDPTFGGLKSPTTTYTDANGIGAFYYEPPTGALALCTANLPDFTPTVTGDTPQDYFKTVLYPGNGTSQSITGVGFQPDLVWIKSRSGTNGNANHALYDSVRGVGANKELTPNETYTEGGGNSSSYGYVSTLDVNGFSIGAGSVSSTQINGSSTNYAAWCFRAGGPPDLTSSPTKPFAKNGVQYETLSAANITAGTITPTAMSVNTDAGFSIVKYTGTGSSATVPHGLSSNPEMVICKTLDTVSATNWVIYFKGATTNSQYLMLNSTANVGTLANYWGTAEPTNNVFSVAAAEYDNNHSNANIIAYCWHSVEGYSKFGSYTGNGSADGPFVYCGFRPAFVICKRTDLSTNGHWIMMDSARKTYNVIDSEKLFANSSAGESSFLNDDTSTDFLSNGFKVRGTYSGINASSSTYIYIAFAEQPFKFSNAR